MNITVFGIEKVKDEAFNSVIKEYLKMTKRFANIKERSIFNKQIAISQTKGEVEAKKSYTKAYEPFLNGYNVSLDVQGEELDSFEFSKIFQESANVNFFIGGAFGFEKDFLAKTQKIISLSKLTYAHKIAKVVLFEQIYRGLCINANHPYHK
ncbi:MAG: 23S rRNA (pseudouridine(1915)-N(3))-methyltransferase RlmH [Epsilonproteobacteria bacterium]|nr:23S rRNA (pseudouridine(1915)-N(3))-methyltransferase RlmH [Campylobacterota bacterium]